MPLGSWGPVVFEVSGDMVRTWKGLQFQRGARWAKIEVYAAKPRKEFLGPDETTGRMEVRLDEQMGLDVQAELDQLREQLEVGANHPLLIGDENIGDFYLKNIGERIERVDKIGKVQLAVCDLAFEEYA